MQSPQTKGVEVYRLDEIGDEKFDLLSSRCFTGKNSWLNVMKNRLVRSCNLQEEMKMTLNYFVVFLISRNQSTRLWHTAGDDSPTLRS